MSGLEMKYFVLKPRGNDQYARASRAAMRRYAKVIAGENQELSRELTAWADAEYADQFEEDGIGPDVAKSNTRPADPVKEQLLEALRELWDYSGVGDGGPGEDEITKKVSSAIAAAKAEQAASTREQRAKEFVTASGKKIHANDCATSISPAEEPGPCDCGEYLNRISPDSLAEHMAKALESAAKTAHYHNTSFCFGAFEECRHCSEWRDVLQDYREANAEAEQRTSYPAAAENQEAK